MTHLGETLPWYALRVKTHREKLVASALTAKSYEVFLPQQRCTRRWSDRIKELELPLFPGYLFCRFDVNRRLPIVMIPGVLHVIGAGKTFLPVDDHEIAAIRSIVESRLNVEPWPFLRIGQTVRIDRGPLLGLQGILVSLKKSYKVVVSVTLLQRSVAVELDHDYVTPVDSGQFLGPHLAA